MDYASAVVMVLGVVLAAAAACCGLVWGRMKVPARMGAAAGASFVGAAAVIEVPRWLIVPAVQGGSMELDAAAAAFVGRLADVLYAAHFALFAGALLFVLTLLVVVRRQSTVME